MTRLTCNVVNCVNNERNLCSRPDIKVEGAQARTEGETFCHSFGHRSPSVVANTAVGSASEETEVRCDARDCAYNQSSVCAADCICVEGHGACDCRQTRCGTFKRA